MTYANYILLVFAVYLMYYATNIVYDKYIKKGKTKLEEDEQIIDLEEGDQEVSQLVTEESIYPVEREEMEIDNHITISNNSNDKQEDEHIVDLGERDQKISPLVTEEGIYPIDGEEMEINNPITTPNDSNDKEGDEHIVDLEERNQEISLSVTEESVYPIEGEEKEIDTPITTPDDKVEMVVETQGIPLDLLLKEGKSMFEGINF